ncbi:MAG: hypothetical protein KAY24_12990, partial [Candidatus Eisenbacteria sp.]|nr:hypothetical protein [Candidatus Eisenbacteria bacterium]
MLLGANDRVFGTHSGQQILTSDIVVGHEPLRSSRVVSGSQRKITREEYLSSLDDNGRAFFEPLVAHAEKRGWPIHWGTNGFSMNCDVGGTHVAMCFGYRPKSVFRQSLYTDF